MQRSISQSTAGADTDKQLVTISGADDYCVQIHRCQVLLYFPN